MGTIRRIVIFALLALVALPAVAHGQEGADRDPDILCDNAPPDSVRAVPPPVDAWIILLCTRSGQSLAPRMRGEVELWLQHDTAYPFQLFAAPPDLLERDPSLGKYDLRFTSFSAALATGGRRDLLLEIWRRAFEEPAVPASLGDVYQLDAYSSHAGWVWNLFVYLEDAAPRWMVVCRDRCRVGYALDVLRGDALKRRVEEHEGPAR